MTKRYTAADFENARYAEHPSGGRGHRVAGDVWRLSDSPLKFSTGQLALDGWVPVIPARTIHDSDVEALCTDTASYERDDYLDGFIQGFQQAGGVILDDPEPTNTDKLTRLINSAQLTGRDARNIAEYLNGYGIRVKDN